MAEPSKLVIDMHFVDGVCLPGSVSEKHLDEVKNFELNPDDVLITGYPRSGNTWLVATVDAIIHADGLEEFEKRGTSTLFLDYDTFLSAIKEQKSPRVIWSHLRYHMLPEDIQRKNVKLIHTTRDPRDVAVSFFHLCQIFRPIAYEGTWDEFFEAYMDGKVNYGSWFDYTKNWDKYQNIPNILSLEYESFLDDIPGTIKKIAEFLGKSLSASEVEHIASIVNFKAMQRNPSLNKETHPALDTTKGQFIRSGKVGQWKEYFTAEQERTFDSAFKAFKERSKMT